MMTSSSNQKEAGLVVVACRVMGPELETVLQAAQGVEIRYLDQALHRTPQRMTSLIQAEIDRASLSAKQIVLGYGLCSNGIVGIVAGEQGLIVPRCHDCIAFFLGSPSKYQEAFRARPGTYYLTPGWVAEKKDPLGIIEEYTPRLGRETAIWVMEEELKHYTHIALIHTGVADLGTVRERAMENAQFLKKAYQEIQGGLDYFRKLVLGPYDDEDFLIITPRQQVTQEMFF